ncbi:hypothetical protein F5890DRAFT_562819, partial [Lentinula detonsa]
MSREMVSTATSHGSTATLSMPISDLERRLSTARCMDIFTVTHKACLNEVSDTAMFLLHILFCLCLLLLLYLIRMLIPLYTFNNL